MPERTNTPTNDRRAWAGVFVLALVHVVLAIWFASITPYRAPGQILASHAPAPDIGAPDERAHANYIQHLLDGKGIPVLDVAQMTPGSTYRAEEYESHQPPLYYMAAFAWCKVVGVSTVSDATAGTRLRALNSVFGAATVLGVFCAAFWGFRRLDLAFAAALFPALLPMNVALSGAISNDPLLFALMAWAMAFIARALRDGWTLKLALGVGALTGLAIVTKTTGIALLPVLLVSAVIPQLKRPGIGQVVAAALAVIVIAGPWLARNQATYHDPLATNVFNKAFGDTATKQLIESAPGGDGLGYWANWVGWWTARSFIGVFGYMDIFLNETGTFKTEPGEAPNTLYRVCLAGLVLLAVGWARSLKEPWASEGKAVTIVNATLVVVVLLLFLRFNNMFFQGQARYLYPALAPIAIGFGAGAITWARKRPSVGVGAVALCLSGLVIYSGFRLPSEFGKRLGTPGPSNSAPRPRVQ